MIVGRRGISARRLAWLLAALAIAVHATCPPASVAVAPARVATVSPSAATEAAGAASEAASGAAEATSAAAEATSAAAEAARAAKEAAGAAAEPPGYGAALASDGRYLVNNVVEDAQDIVTAPLHLGEIGSTLAKPAVAYSILGAAVALGGAFALDETLRAHIRNMSASDALDLETAGTAFVAGGTALLYGYGLYEDDQRAREYALTGGESAGIASLFTLGVKYAFGRQRPNAGKGAFRFFDGGQSFVSGEATPVFALAAAVSEYFDNAWWAAVPAYSGALTVGLGRMGHDAHWFSDIVGAGIVGVGWTELLLHLHLEHANDPTRFRVFPTVDEQSAGLEVAYAW